MLAAIGLAVALLHRRAAEPPARASRTGKPAGVAEPASLPGLRPAPAFGPTGPAFRVVWRRVADLPEPREKFGAAVLGGLIYVVGGESPGGILASVVTFDPARGRWAGSASLNAARCSHGVVVVGGRLYALGGFDGRSLLGSVEVFDPAAGSWQTVEGAAGKMPTPRSGLVCAAAGGRIYTFGGDRPVVEVFDPATRRWESRGGLPWGLSAASAVAWRDTIYLIGGFGVQATSPAVHVYDPRAARWLADAEHLQQARAGLAAVCDARGVCFAIGGRSGSPQGLVEVCRAPGEPWWGVEGLPAPRTNLQAVIAGGKLYAIGGADRAPEASVFEGTVVRSNP